MEPAPNWTCRSKVKLNDELDLWKIETGQVEWVIAKRVSKCKPASKRYLWSESLLPGCSIIGFFSTQAAAPISAGVSIFRPAYPTSYLSTNKQSDTYPAIPIASSASPTVTTTNQRKLLLTTVSWFLRPSPAPQPNFLEVRIISGPIPISWGKSGHNTSHAAEISPAN